MPEISGMGSRDPIKPNAENVSSPFQQKTKELNNAAKIVFTQKKEEGAGKPPAHQYSLGTDQDSVLKRLKTGS